MLRKRKRDGGWSAEAIETYKQRGKVQMERKERGRERNLTTSDSLALLGQAQHTSPVTRDWGRHVSSQIAPQTHWQELSAERGERLFLAYSHARVNHWQLQRGGAIKRPWWRGTGVCGLRYSGVISHCDLNQPFLKCWKSVHFNPGVVLYAGLGLVLKTAAPSVCVNVRLCKRMGVEGLRGWGFRGDEAVNWRGPHQTLGSWAPGVRSCQRARGQKIPSLSCECEQVMIVKRYRWIL